MKDEDRTSGAWRVGQTEEEDTGVGLIQLPDQLSSDCT